MPGTTPMPDPRPSLPSSASSVSLSPSTKVSKPARFLPRLGPMPFSFSFEPPSAPTPTASSSGVVPLTAVNLALLASLESPLASTYPDEVSHFSSDTEETSTVSSFNEPLVENPSEQRLPPGMPLPNFMPMNCTPEHDSSTPHCFGQTSRPEEFPFPTIPPLTASIRS